jgi:hypothetical protein
MSFQHGKRRRKSIPNPSSHNPTHRTRCKTNMPITHAPSIYSFIHPPPKTKTHPIPTIHNPHAIPSTNKPTNQPSLSKPTKNQPNHNPTFPTTHLVVSSHFVLRSHLSRLSTSLLGNHSKYLPANFRIRSEVFISIYLVSVAQW